MSMRPAYLAALAAGLAPFLPACAWLIDFPDYEVGSGSTSGSGGMTGSGGAGGTGAAGGTGGAVSCVPLSKISCYAGAKGTDGIGACHSGTAVCNQTGTALGPCEGQVIPTPEPCDAGIDLDCDGSVGCSGAGLWAHRFGDAEERGQSVAAAAGGEVLAVGRFGGAVDLGSGPLVSGDGTADMFVARRATDGGAVWSKSFTSVETGAGRAIASNASGAVVVIGTLVKEGNQRDIFLARLDAGDGSVVWQKTFGDAAAQTGFSVAIDATGSIAVTGDFAGTLDFDGPGGSPALVASGQQDAFVAQFDASGAILWARRFGGTGTAVSHGGSISIDPAGGVVVLGDFTGSIDLGSGPVMSKGKDLYIAKMDATGALQWAKQLGDDKDQNARAIVTGSDGAIAVTGAFAGAIDFGGPTGLVSSIGSNGSDIFLAKLFADGTPAYVKVFGDDYKTNCAGRDVAFDAQGNLALTGDFGGTVAFDAITLKGSSGEAAFYAKLDPTGAVLWAKELPGSSVIDNYGRGVAYDDNGDVLATGDFEGPTDFGSGAVPTVESSAFIMKLAGATGNPFVDPKTGNSQWPVRVGEADEQSRAMAVDAEGRIFLGGLFGGALNFAPEPLVSQAPGLGYDGFLAAFDGSGAALSQARYGGALSQSITSLWPMSDGSLVATGTFDGTLTFDGLPPLQSEVRPDVYVTRFGADGKPKVSTLVAVGTDGVMTEPWVCGDAKGNVVVTSNYWGKLDLPVTVLGGGGSTTLLAGKITPEGTWSWGVSYGHGPSTHTSARCAIDPSGNVILAGGTYVSGSDGDVFLAKLDPDGKPLWDRKLGDSNEQSASAVVADKDGSLLVIGRVSSGKLTFDPAKDSPACTSVAAASGVNTFLARFTPDGSCVWAEALSGGSGATRVLLAPTGDILAFRTGSGLVAVDKLDPNGKVRWSVPMTGAGSLNFPGIALDPLGNIYLTVTFAGTVNHPTLGSFYTVGGNDILLMKLAP